MVQDKGWFFGGEMSELTSGLNLVEDFFKGVSKGFFAKLDDMTFKMTIDGLKNNDYEAVSIIIDQLVKENKPVSIPPLYVVSQAHPNPNVRVKAEKAIATLDHDKVVPKLTTGKSMQDGAKALIEHYGNFKR